MKILLVVRWPVGGIRTYLRYIFRHQALVEHDYVLLSPPVEGLDVIKDAFSGGKLSTVTSGGSSLDVFKKTTHHVRHWRPDIIHSHGFTSGILSAPIARLTGTPHVLTSHDVLFEKQFPGFRGRLRRYGVLAALRSVDHLMAVGEDALSNLIEFYPSLGRDGKSSAIRNGIDVQVFLGDDRRNLRAELNLPAETVLLGFFGRFMAQKGFNLLVDALEQSRAQGIDVQVACFGWGGYIREEQEELRSRQLDNYFHFLPHTDAMAAALRGVDVVTMPSRWEACPLLPMEAMVSGAPVIASDCVGMHEVVKHTPALVFASGDRDALSARIAEVAADRGTLLNIAEAFRAEAARRFDSAESAHGLARLYERVVASKAGG